MAEGQPSSQSIPPNSSTPATDTSLQEKDIQMPDLSMTQSPSGPVEEGAELAKETKGTSSSWL